MVQLGARRIFEIILEVQKVEVQSYAEIPLSVNREASPLEVWRSVKANLEKHFNKSLVRLMGGARPASFRRWRSTTEEKIASRQP